MDRHIKAWQKIKYSTRRERLGRSGGSSIYEPDVPQRARQKSIRVLRDLIFVLIIFDFAFVMASVLDLHSSFQAASIQLKNSPFQYDEVNVALAKW